MFTVSSLSTVAENVDMYDVNISYGTRHNGSNLSAIVVVMNSFCPQFHFLAVFIIPARLTDATIHFVHY